MRRVITLCVATIFSCGAAISAQTQQTGQTQQTPTQRQETPTASQTQGRAATSMFIGCVEKGSTPNAFVLNVLEIPGSTTATTGQTQARSNPGGTQATGTTGATMVGHRMELIGGTNVAAHVGHKVEITGMVVPQGSATGRTGQTAAADMRVNVSNVRMIDANCSAIAGTRGTAGTSGTSEPAPAPREQNQKTQPDPQTTPEQRQY